MGDLKSYSVKKLLVSIDNIYRYMHIIHNPDDTSDYERRKGKNV